VYIFDLPVKFDKLYSYIFPCQVVFVPCSDGMIYHIVSNVMMLVVLS